MDYSKFSYPKYETPLLQAYDGRFNAAFVALHPFFRMPPSVDWKAVEIEYPEDIFIRQYSQVVYWQTIMDGIGCEDLRLLYIGMRTSIGALKQEYENKEMMKLIDQYTDQGDIYHPTEGMIQALLVEPISQYISHEQTDKILFLPEFEEEPEELSAEIVIQKCDNEYLRGSLFALNVTRLVTVDWDDFFTVIYGSRYELDLLLENKSLEGFFYDDKTLHDWCWQDRLLKPVVI